MSELGSVAGDSAKHLRNLTDGAGGRGRIVGEEAGVEGEGMVGKVPLSRVPMYPWVQGAHR